MRNLFFFFLDQEVDYEALICLEAKDLVTLLPKAGPRAKFCKKLEAHKLAELEVSTKYIIHIIYLLNLYFQINDAASRLILSMFLFTDQNELSIFINLAKLFTPTVVRLENGKRWKPNSQEICDGFLLHIKVNFFL